MTDNQNKMENKAFGTKKDNVGSTNL